MPRPGACRRTRREARPLGPRRRLHRRRTRRARCLRPRCRRAVRTANAPRGSPSLGLPTEPQLTNSTPPYSWTQGLCVWPNTSTGSLSAAASRSYRLAGLSSNRYSLTFRGEPWTRWTSTLPTGKCRSNGRPRMKSLDCWACVRECPVHRALSKLAVMRGDIRAAAVLEVACDGVVVVAVDRRNVALGDQGADLVGVRAVANEVAAAERRSRCQAPRSARAPLAAPGGCRGCR